MIDPTPEQIVAAARAMNEASSGFFSESSWRHLAREAIVAAADAAPQEAVDTAELITEARALAVRKVEDSADAEALQIMVGLLCDRLEQGFGR